MATVTTPPPPRSDELEALIEEARQRQRRRRQRIGVALVLATALLGVVTYAVVAVVGSTSLRSGSQPTSAPAGAGRPRIVFAANRVAVLYGEIYSVGLDGRRTNLSRSAARDIAPAVSPDGKRVAFLSDRHGGVALYAARLHGGSLVKLSPYLFPPYSAGGLDGQVAWSPDGRRIAVAAQSPASAALYLGGMNGRGKVIDTEFTDELAWSSDGRLLAYRAHLYPSAAAAGAPVKVGGPARRAGGLRVVDTDGAAAWHVNSIDPRSLAWSSTGRLAVGLERKTRVYDARGRVLSSFPGTAFGSPWSPSGDRLASLRRGRLEIRRGGTGRPVVSLRAAGQGGVEWIGDEQVAFATDAGWTSVDLATGRRSRTPRAWIEAIRPGGRIAWITPANVLTVPAPRPFALGVSRFDGGLAHTLARMPACHSDIPFGAVQFTPDGRSLVYQTSCTEPSANIYAMSPDGTHLRRLTRTISYQTMPSLSPDRHSIAFSQSAGAVLGCKGCTTAIWRMNVNGAHARPLTYPGPASGAQDLSPSWSPDGREIVYSRMDLTSTGQLYIVNAAGGRSRALHIAGFAPAWGPKKVAYIDVRDDSLWTVNPDGSRPHRLAAGPVGDYAWSRDGRLAYLGGQGRTLHVIGNGRTSFRLPLPASALTWSPDGTGLFVSAGEGTRPTELYSVGSDGHDFVQLTSNLGAILGLSAQ